MAYRANQQQLREDIWDYRYPAAPDAPLGALRDEDDKIVSFARQPAKEFVKAPGTTALSLMQQAAEMFEGIENQARQTEARAQSLCKGATERLKLAEKQRDASERARRELINEFNGRLEQMSKAMQRAEKRVVAAEDHALAAEFRAQAAEAQLHKANRELAAIEDLIRKRLV
jgi:hypothetical protein